MPQDQILGRGKCYFDKFAPGTFNTTGELYFGNSPSLELAVASTMLDHFDSDEGMKVKDITITLQQDVTTTLQVDNISTDNLALWFTGSKAKVTQAASASPVAPETIIVTPGAWYQLGVSPTNIAGVGAVTDFDAKTTDATPAEIPLTNFNIDLKNGRFQVKPDAADITDTKPISVTYKLAADTYDQVVSAGDQIMGAFRFISHNAYGPSRNYFMPYTKITADGNFQLKGDAWQQLQFKLEVLKKDSATERVYLDGRPM
ncbi:major tail protein with Ig-like domain [Burkholderia phage BcepNazgul]|uniref:Uncharacterized protein n=1 Tax=Burkholderia phage BcepNazgul TaxID=242861 RepID=Q6UYI8_9CAUD|nr:major tail protein with Ig-like domain [Burkholderia phage BcepNazgul]AAQ63353.1 hypothetical protein Nazgul53 [Burkholderia phage BcepNazgul]